MTRSAGGCRHDHNRPWDAHRQQKKQAPQQVDALTPTRLTVEHSTTPRPRRSRLTHAQTHGAAGRRSTPPPRCSSATQASSQLKNSPLAHSPPPHTTLSNSTEEPPPPQNALLQARPAVAQPAVSAPPPTSPPHRVPSPSRPTRRAVRLVLQGEKCRTTVAHQGRPARRRDGGGVCWCTGTPVDCRPCRRLGASRRTDCRCGCTRAERAWPGGGAAPGPQRWPSAVLTSSGGGTVRGGVWMGCGGQGHVGEHRPRGGVPTCDECRRDALAFGWGGGGGCAGCPPQTAGAGKAGQPIAGRVQ